MIFHTHKKMALVYHQLISCFDSSVTPVFPRLLGFVFSKQLRVSVCAGALRGSSRVTSHTGRRSEQVCLFHSWKESKYQWRRTSPFCPAVSCRLRLTMAPKCIGGCAALFVLGVAFDITGFALLSVRIFANLRLNDRFYGDFLIYTGSLKFFSVFSGG